MMNASSLTPPRPLVTLRRFFLPVGCLAAGAAVICLLFPLWVLLIMAGTALSVAAILCRDRDRAANARAKNARVLLIALTVLLLIDGCALCGVRRVEAFAGQTDRVTAEITGRAAESRWYFARVTDGKRLPGGTRLLLFCSEDIAPDTGDTVTGEVSLAPLYDTQSSYKADGIFLRAYPTDYADTGWTVTAATAPPDIFAALRDRLADAARRIFPGQTGELTAAICLGDRTGLADSITEDFRRCGLPHLTVVSGLHLALVAYTVLKLTKFLHCPRKVGVLITALATAGFAALVGLSPSVLRAGLTCLILLGGIALRRVPDGLNSLGLALTVMLGGAPYLITDAGFLLSFGSVAGILCLSPLIRQALTVTKHHGRLARAWNAVLSPLAVSLGASLAVTPVLAYLFGEVSVIAPLSNLLAVLPAEWLLRLALPVMFLGLIPGAVPVLRQACLPIRWLAEWLLTVAKRLGDLSFAAVPWEMACLPFLLTVIFLAAVLLCRRLPRKKRLVPIMGAICAAAMTVSGVLMMFFTPAVQVLTDGGHVAVLVRESGHRALIADDAAVLYTARREFPKGGVDTLIVLNGATSRTAAVNELLCDPRTERVLIAGDGDWWLGLPGDMEPLPADGKVTLWDTCAVGLTAHEWQVTAYGRTVSVVFPGLRERAVSPDVAVFLPGAVPDRSAPRQGVVLNAALAVKRDYPLTVRRDGRATVALFGYKEWRTVE